MTLRHFNNYDHPDPRFPRVLAWNPIAMRCTRVDDGCRNCWHLRMADRLAKNPTLSKEARGGYSGESVHAPVYGICDGTSILPRKPSVIAVQFMGDLFHECVEEEERRQIIMCMRKRPEHIFLLLTKRPECGTEELPENCWLGTSVSDQASADVRITQLLKTKSKHKWLSIEPILGEVDLTRWFCRIDQNGEPYGLRSIAGLPAIDFVACGGETGAGARPHKTGWIVDVAHECAESGIPFYDKRDPSAPGFTRREWPRAWRDHIGGAKWPA